MKKVRVYVIKKAQSKYWYLKWIDPDSGRSRFKSCRTRVRRDAERMAANMERDLASGEYYERSLASWSVFRMRYTDEVLAGLAKKTHNKQMCTFNLFEQWVGVTWLREIDANKLSEFIVQLRKHKRKEITINSHIVVLRTAMKWAKDVKLIDRLPIFPQLKRAKKVGKSTPMKGRPITREEFERIVEKVPSVVGEKRAPDWAKFIEGLWASGLRLEEAIYLCWESDSYLSIDLSGRYPMFKVPAEAEKGHRDRLTPMAPEFAKMINKTPKRKRRGFLFDLPTRSLKVDRPDLHTASKLICKMGKEANVKVSETKYASAHDFRRSFGERWSHILMPADLQQLMRHESIETTMRFYVGRNAQSVTAKLYEAALGNNSGNSSSDTSKDDGSLNKKSPEIQG